MQGLDPAHSQASHFWKPLFETRKLHESQQMLLVLATRNIRVDDSDAGEEAEEVQIQRVCSQK